MMKFLGLLMKRPEDKQIKYIKVTFGILLIVTSVIVFNVQSLSIENILFGYTLTGQAKMYLSYAIMAIGIFPLILGGLDLSILSRGRTRILQIVFGILLMFISGIFIDKPTITADVLYFFLGLFAFLAGVTGKAITKKGLKYGQKITKIRV